VGIEHRLVVFDEVHLGHRKDEMANPDQVAEMRMAAGLGHHPGARVEQNDREIGGRGAGHHVAGILLVPRAVGDDETAFLGREITVSDVDRDALLALGGKTVDQQRKVDLVAARARRPAVPGQRRHLVVEHLPAVVEQAPDQRRFAVVDAPAGDKAKEIGH